MEWLRKAIQDCNWWYRPEVLEDDDLAGLKNDEAFLSLKAISDDAVSKSKAIFSWKKKTADNLFLVIHGNTQNSTQARADWKPIVGRNSRWQIPWKWYKTRAITKLLAAVFLPDAICFFVRLPLRRRAGCDLLILQSPWIPILQDHSEDVVRAISQKNIKLRLFCDAEDEDCLPMAKQLYTAARQAGCNVTLTVQENTRHRFPAQLYHV